MDDLIIEYEGHSYIKTPPPMPTHDVPPSGSALGEPEPRSVGAAAAPAFEPPTARRAAASATAVAAGPAAARRAFTLMVLAPAAFLILGAFLLGQSAALGLSESGLLIGVGIVSLVAGFVLLARFRRPVYFKGQATVSVRRAEG